MSETAVPYNLRPKATKLESGPDDSLEPRSPPTDPAQRGAAPFVWPRVDTSKGGTGPPDGPLAPPATDSALRTLPPFAWPRPAGTVPNRPLRETIAPEPALDPDIAMWPEIVVSIWPFTGHPTTGIWPVGWMGADNTGTVWVCTVAGAPGTWASIGGGGVLTNWGQASTAKFVGSGSPLGVVTPTGAGDLYVDDTSPAAGLWQATGAASGDWSKIASPFQSSGAGTIGTGYTVTVTATTFLTTAALNAGFYLLVFTGILEATGPTDQASVTLATGTASASFAGPVQCLATVTGTGITMLTIATRVHVTAAGTLVYEAQGSGGASLITGGAGYVAIPVLQ